MKTIQNKLQSVDALISTIESSDPVLSCWVAYRAELAEKLAETIIKPGQVVRLVNMPNAKRVVIVGVRSNGIWIRRTATDGEFYRRGVDQVKERVRFADIIAV